MIAAIEQPTFVSPKCLRTAGVPPLPTKAGAIDLCCGLGGLSLAAEQLGFEIIAGIDVKEDALKTFSKNFPKSLPLLGSVRSKTILQSCESAVQRYREAGRPVVILSGPPCQGFSVAGSRNPVDPRNQILVAVARAIVELQPDCALIENVSTLLDGKYAKRVDKFEATLAKDGYHIVSFTLNASDYGVPQKRKRTFFLISQRELNYASITEDLIGKKVTFISTREALAGLKTPPVRPETYDDEASQLGIYNHFAMRHSERVKAKIAAIEPGTGPMSYRRLHPTRLSNTLFSGHRAPPAHFAEARSITVREAARLQGFPDSFRIYGSFSNQMEQVTNAVPPPLAKAVLATLIRHAGLEARLQ